MSTPTTTYLNTGPYHEIISGISTVFSFSDGVVKLTGPLGVGKSSVLLELVKELRNESFEVVDFKIPPKSPDDLQSTLIRKFKLGADLSFRKSLIRYLSTKPRDLQKLILIIDDANLMSVEALAGLHALRDLENNGQALISLLLCGDKTLNALLAQPELAMLQADISLNYTLNPLDDGELSEFCTTYLQLVGKGRIALSENYLTGLQERTRGLPAEVLAELETVLADPEFLILHRQADLPAEKKNEEPALIGQMINSIAEQINNIPPETKRWLKPTFNAMLAVAAASTVYVYYPRMMALYGEYMHSPSQSATNSTPEVAVNPTPTPAVPAQQPAQQPIQQPAVAVAPTPAPAPVPEVPPATVVQPPVPSSQPVATAPQVQPAPVRTAAPAPAPAPALAAQPVVTVPVSAAPASAADLEAVVNRWVSAWQQQDADAYLSFYHTDFAPLYNDNRSSWRNERILSIKRPTHIELMLSDLEVAGTDPTGTTVRFHLGYQSATYADRTLKELVLGRDLDGQLRILREINLDIEVQPGGRLAATPPTATTPSTTPAATPAATTATTASPPRQTAASLITATRIGEPMVIQPNAEITGLPNNRNNINQFVSSWLNSWQHKDLQSYFSHYDPQFTTPLLTNTVAWRDERTVKIARPAVIQLQLEHMELVNESGEETVLHLTLAYHSSFYADRTEKELRLRRASDGNLQIVEEKNIAVETLPLSRLLPSNKVAMRELVLSIAANQL